MSIGAIILVVYMISLLALWIWVHRCIHVSHQEMMTVICMVPLLPVSGSALMKAYRAVPFKRHLRARLLGRDAWKLYDPIVKHAVDHPDTEIVGGIHIVFTDDGPHVKTYGGVDAGDLHLVQHDDEDVPQPLRH